METHNETQDNTNILAYTGNSGGMRRWEGGTQQKGEQYGPSMVVLSTQEQSAHSYAVSPEHTSRGSPPRPMGQLTLGLPNQKSACISAESRSLEETPKASYSQSSISSAVCYISTQKN